MPTLVERPDMFVILDENMRRSMEIPEGPALLTLASIGPPVHVNTTRPVPIFYRLERHDLTRPVFCCHPDTWRDHYLELEAIIRENPAREPLFCTPDSQSTLRGTVRYVKPDQEPPDD